jgi:hypothetical protein
MFFPEMHLSAQFEVRIRVVIRMHYRAAGLLIEWELEINYREGRGSLWRRRNTIHRFEAQEADANHLLAKLEHAFARYQTSGARPSGM